MSTDENYAFYSQDTHSKYVCVLIDQQTGRPIDSGNLKITNLDRLIFTKNGEFTI